MTHTFVVDVTQQDTFSGTDYPTVVTLINSKQSIVVNSYNNGSNRANIAFLLTQHHSRVARFQLHLSSTSIYRFVERTYNHCP